MDEKEFNRQVWRAFDTVDIDGVVEKGRVINVCFPSKSVRVAVAPKVVEWFKCDSITNHYSATGEPDDLTIIADLHERLTQACDKIENQQNTIKVLNEKLKVDPNDGLKDLRKSVTVIRDSLASKLKRMEQAVSAMDRINKWLDERGITQE